MFIASLGGLGPLQSMVNIRQHGTTLTLVNDPNM